MSTDLETSFLAFCNSVKKSSTTATDKTLKKICTDGKIYCKGLDANRVDIEFRGHIGNTRKTVDYADFVKFIEGRLAKAYATAKGIDEAKAVETLKEKIANASPATHGATKVSNDAITSRLTDVKTFTGSHKERFDDTTGKGRGKAGRVDASPAFTTTGFAEPRK